MLLHVIPAQICYILFLPKIHGEFQGLEGSEGRGASRASGRTRGLILDTSFFSNLSIAFGEQPPLYLAMQTTRRVGRTRRKCVVFILIAPSSKSVVRYILVQYRDAFGILVGANPPILACFQLYSEWSRAQPSSSDAHRGRADYTPSDPSQRS